MHQNMDMSPLVGVGVGRGVGCVVGEGVGNLVGDGVGNHVGGFVMQAGSQHGPALAVPHLENMYMKADRIIPNPV